jgi:hypothetical protein
VSVRLLKDYLAENRKPIPSTQNHAMQNIDWLQLSLRHLKKVPNLFGTCPLVQGEDAA